KLIFSLISVMLFSNKFVLAQSSQVTECHVSFSGDDNAIGNSLAPFRTINRAIEETEIIKKNSLRANPVNILIHKGTYIIEKSIVLNNQNSALTIKNYPGEEVHFIGGKEITGFKKLTDEGVIKRLNINAAKNIYVVNLKDIGINDFGHITNRGGPGMELYFNNQRQQLARWPNDGWVNIASVPQTGELVFAGDPNHQRDSGINTGRHYGRFKYEGDEPSKWSDPGSISLFGYWVHDWHDEYLSIQNIDTAKREFFIKPPHSGYGYHTGQKYYAINVLEELDKPGEWYINRKTGMLYLWPASAIEKSFAFVSLLNEPMMQLNSTAGIKIEGINFEFSRGNGIIINGGKDNLIRGCTFNNLGNIAIILNGGKRNGVKSCDIFDVSAGGIVLDGGDRMKLEPGNSFAENNHIHHFGKWLKTHQAGITIRGMANRIANNLIHDGPNAGIMLSGNAHIIEYNDLHDLSQETEDAGAFYMGRNWTQKENVIRYNYFHDLMGYHRHDANAVYLDDFTSDVKVIGNIFYKCATGIMIGGGRLNTVKSNLFGDCLLGISLDNRGQGWASYYFTGGEDDLETAMKEVNYDKPPYSVKYPDLLTLYADSPMTAKYNEINSNISYNGKWLHLLYGITFKEVNSINNLIWLPKGEEYKNGTKDKVFYGAAGIKRLENGRFMLDPKMYKMGFLPVPYSKMGLQRDTYRKNPFKSFGELKVMNNTN
ncbi:MAG: right-handed parallel beta-helix repeat-containing protein, partial [Chitinophagaceae bacterium]